MKRVVLIGDSIRMGYEDTVKQELAGVAEVWSPAENGGTTANVLVNLNGWAFQQQPDVVHINCGLHDLKTIYYGGRDNVIPIEHYRANVEKILRVIRERTSAKVIWATTTPIDEKKAHAAHAQEADFDRYEADVVAYNRAALEATKRVGVPVNDLNAVIIEAGKDKCLIEDGVHFTPDACALLGKTAAAVIRKHL